MTAKLKNNQRIGRKTFFVAWVGVSILGVLLNIFQMYAIYNALSPIFYFVDGLLFLVVILVVSGIHQWLLWRSFGVLIRRWWLWSTIAWIVGYVIGGEIARYLGSQLFIMDESVLYLLFVLAFFALFSVPSLVQSYLLRLHFKHTWLLAVSILVLGLLIRSIVVFIISELVTLTVYRIISLVFSEIIIYAVVSGLVLLWLDHITYEHVDETHIAEVET